MLSRLFQTQPIASGQPIELIEKLELQAYGTRMRAVPHHGIASTEHRTRVDSSGAVFVHATQFITPLVPFDKVFISDMEYLMGTGQCRILPKAVYFFMAWDKLQGPCPSFVALFVCSRLYILISLDCFVICGV